MLNEIKVRKKDGTLREWKPEKIVIAIRKSAKRIAVTLTEQQENQVVQYVEKNTMRILQERSDYVDYEKNVIPILTVHSLVEGALDRIVPDVAKSYKDYRNYKSEYADMMDEVYQEDQAIRFLGDRSNANSDSKLVSTKRTLCYNSMNTRLYEKFFLNRDELQAQRDGYIYIHDRSARRDTMNCCLFDMTAVLSGGFEMNGLFYNEPKSLDTAFDVMGDVILSAASQQYGGFTVPEIDKILAPYAEKSYTGYIKEFCEMQMADIPEDKLQKAAHSYAMKKTEREMEQGYQGIEYKLNTVASSRGDYPFVTITFGLGTNPFEKMVSKTILRVHAVGQGKTGFKKPVLFPKLVFLYDQNLHGKGCVNEDLFEAGIECSAKTMYPDWLSLTGDGYVSSIYKKYGKAISPMGCRAFLSPWYERGGMQPADETDEPVFVGRFNLGVVSLNLPMIDRKSVV